MDSLSSNVCDWSPLKIFDLKQTAVDGHTGRTALLVLNQPLDHLAHIFNHLWDTSAVRVFVDGAVNRVSTCFGESRYMPDLVCGDLDSAEERLLEHYRSKGVKVVHVPDQDYTDFHKSLQVLMQHIAENPQSKVERVVVLGAFGGRLDHTLANLQVLYKLRDIPSHSILPSIFLVDDVNVAWLLSEGSHRIHVDSGLEGGWCGLVPLGGACDRVTTTGLHWNLGVANAVECRLFTFSYLDCQRMEMSGLISTSNRLASPAPAVVTVSCSQPLLWCMGVDMTRLPLPSPHSPSS